MSDGHASILRLDGESLTLEDLVRVARDPTIKVQISPEGMTRIANCRKIIDGIVDHYTRAHAAGQDVTPHQVYGVTTGFGEFKTIAVEPAELVTLQENILLSHAVGAGESADEHNAANYFSADVVRAALVQRLNTFAKGHSGIRPAMVECVLEMLNGGIIPLVPIKGSCGSSGDLCPLAHLFVGLLGHGRFYRVATRDEVPRGMPASDQVRPAIELKQILANHTTPQHKEGLALTNGAAFSAAALALATFDAEQLARTSDVAAAMTLESIEGRTRALDDAVHVARRMTGQREAAAHMRELLAGSDFTDRTIDVQDAYSVRCAPQVHGASRDAIGYVRGIVEAEINAATDNPLFFPDQLTPWDVTVRRQRGDDPATIGQSPAYSAGNFHGQPIALASDFLCIAVAELANISERRIQMMLDSHHNRGLWPNLSARPGVNSGFMIAQYSAAAIVSENKVLAHPASVDSIPTSSNVEDHVAMATHAARKARMVVSNAQAVLAIELLVAAQAVEVRSVVGSSHHQTEAKAQAVDVAAKARERAEDLSRRAPALAHELSKKLGRGTYQAYKLVRSRVATLVEDRYLEPDVRAVRQLVADGAFATQIK